MNLIQNLNKELLSQSFSHESHPEECLSEWQKIAQGYAQVENSIAVLSDLKANKSYIFTGKMGEKFGLGNEENLEIIDSIWEEKLFDRIHPDDLTEKHRLELYFLQFLKSLPPQHRCDYHITSPMRMLDKTGRYVAVHHRMFYVQSDPSGNLGLALCLYNYSYTDESIGRDRGSIVNSACGEIRHVEEQSYRDLLSRREKEILAFIEKGKISKEIAEILSISKNTISRHRQNILAKLRVKNSLEACRIAKRMGII